MIYGVGTDICDIRRIGATLQRRGERFAEKVLGPTELKVFRDRFCTSNACNLGGGVNLEILAQEAQNDSGTCIR